MASMTAHAVMRVDKAMFWRFVTQAHSAHRYEYVGGWIMQQQAGGTRRHSRIASNIIAALAARLDPVVWVVNTSDRLIDLGAQVRQSDVSVERADTSSDASIATTQPVIIVEVLSPLSKERDLSTKPAEYMQLASLQAYLVTSQSEPLCHVWRRAADGVFSDAPQRLEGHDARFETVTPNLSIPLSEIFRGIVW